MSSLDEVSRTARFRRRWCAPTPNGPSDRTKPSPTAHADGHDTSVGPGPPTGLPAATVLRPRRRRSRPGPRYAGSRSASDATSDSRIAVYARIASAASSVTPMTGAPIRLSSAVPTIRPIDEHEQPEVHAPERRAGRSSRAHLGPQHQHGQQPERDVGDDPDVRRVVAGQQHADGCGRVGRVDPVEMTTNTTYMNITIAPTTQIDDAAKWRIGVGRAQLHAERARPDPHDEQHHRDELGQQVDAAAGLFGAEQQADRDDEPAEEQRADLDERRAAACPASRGCAIR